MFLTVSRLLVVILYTKNVCRHTKIAAEVIKAQLEVEEFALKTIMHLFISHFCFLLSTVTSVGPVKGNGCLEETLDESDYLERIKNKEEHI